MKKLLLITGTILVTILAFAYNKLSSTGYFRTIENTTDYSVSRSFDIPGAEDLALSREGQFLIISSDDRAKRDQPNERKGGIYLLDLSVPSASPQLISGDFNQPFFPHGISLIKLDSTSYRLFVINHVDKKNSIEIFHLKDHQLSHEQTLEDNLLVSPNDIVAIDEHRFYYTNDHLSESGFNNFAAKYLGKADANVGYFDGEKFSIVAEGFHYANGINFDQERQLLYVASMLKFNIKVFEKNDNGSLTHLEDIACHTGVDNIELDQQSDLWVGCHPNLLAAQAYLGGKSQQAPSEIIKIEYRSRGDYSVESVYLNNGETTSASSVALPYGEELFIGNVRDKKFVAITQQ